MLVQTKMRIHVLVEWAVPVVHGRTDAQLEQLRSNGRSGIFPHSLGARTGRHENMGN